MSLTKQDVYNNLDVSVYVENLFHYYSQFEQDVKQHLNKERGVIEKELKVCSAGRKHSGAIRKGRLLKLIFIRPPSLQLQNCYTPCGTYMQMMEMLQLPRNIFLLFILLEC